MNIYSKKFTKQHHDPIELMKSYWPDADISHITYDENMKPSDRQYWRMWNIGGDGTLLFTIQMMQKCLLPLINGNCFYLPEGPEDWSKVKGIKYTIGRMSHATVFGMIKLGCSNDRKYPGQQERVRIPVKCEIVYL